jgi:predicted Zn finger-like uncharacterized protein
MQASCPNCQQKIVVDDAKVPDRAFSVKCPKCQTVVRFPGKGQAAAAPPPPPPPAPSANSSGADWTTPAPSAQSLNDMKAEMMAELRRQMSRPGGLSQTGKILVSMPDGADTQNIVATLSSAGFVAEAHDTDQDGGRLMEQGDYTILVTSREPGMGGREGLYQRCARFSPESRRRVLITLVGDEFKSGDGTQAWAVNADLVVNARDVSMLPGLLASINAERHRLYQAFNDARKRAEEAASH